MKENKQFYFSDKPIDLADITPLGTEYPEETFSPEPKEITTSFTCEVSEETAEFFKKQMEELEAEEKKILEKYRKIAKDNAEHYLPCINKLESEESKKELLEYIIQFALCKGWNDCFDINVKHEKQQTTLF